MFYSRQNMEKCILVLPHLQRNGLQQKTVFGLVSGGGLLVVVAILWCLKSFSTEIMQVDTNVKL